MTPWSVIFPIDQIRKARWRGLLRVTPANGRDRGGNGRTPAGLLHRGGLFAFRAQGPELGAQQRRRLCSFMLSRRSQHKTVPALTPVLTRKTRRKTPHPRVSPLILQTCGLQGERGALGPVTEPASSAPLCLAPGLPGHTVANEETKPPFTLPSFADEETGAQSRLKTQRTNGQIRG